MFYFEHVIYISPNLQFKIINSNTNAILLKKSVSSLSLDTCIWFSSFLLMSALKVEQYDHGKLNSCVILKINKKKEILQ